MLRILPITARWYHLQIKDRPRDWHVSWFIAQTVGVVVIPPTDFYSVYVFALPSLVLDGLFLSHLVSIRI